LKKEPPAAIEQCELLGRLQARFPLCAEPFAELGKELGMNEAQVLAAIRDLKSRGILRQISPVLDARKLGYRSTLVALKVAEDNLAKAEEAIRRHAGISHAYMREHDFNLWVTLAVARGAEVSEELAKLGEETGAQAVCDLPALKVFKLQALFGAELDESPAGAGTDALSGPVELNALERNAINALQQDLPLVSRPFDEMAGFISAGGRTNPEEFLEVCRSLRDKGVIRRYGASINHRRAGFQANAMCCWALPSDQAEALGRKLAGLAAVSHCYIRQTSPLWQYNLYAMVHGRDRAGCESAVREVTESGEGGGPLMLYSTREIKKTRIRYAV
jgi:siroheme decarboxylase